MFDFLGNIANIWWLAPVVSFIISSITSTAGVSGAFLLLPYQVSVMHILSPSASATNHLFNVVGIPGGIIRYVREGRMIWALAWICAIGTLPGVFIGTVIRINWLPDPKMFKTFVGIILFLIAFRLLLDIIKTKNRGAGAKSLNQRKNEQNDLPKIKTLKLNISFLQYEFEGVTYKAPVIKIIIICLLVGIVGGIYGIGGGSIIVPIFVSFFGLPIYTIAGPALFSTFLTSAAGVLFFQLLAPFYPTLKISPDWVTGILFGVGGFGGMYFGAFIQKYMPQVIIKIILLAGIIYISLNYILPLL